MFNRPKNRSILTNGVSSKVANRVRLVRSSSTEASANPDPVEIQAAQGRRRYYEGRVLQVKVEQFNFSTWSSSKWRIVPVQLSQCERCSGA
uniref:Uncharacterized protein n=1 Tax=Ascaris lumbricoides TaxID=6252 RepID=A0A0M3HX18_ASCLU